MQEIIVPTCSNWTPTTGGQVVCTDPATGAFISPTLSSGVLLSPDEYTTLTGAAPDKVQNFKDGMVLGWGVASAIIIVYLIRRVYR